MNNKPLHTRIITAVLGFSLAALTGCVVTPVPLTDQDRAAQAQADLAALFVDQEAVSGPITMAEAMARAIKYNLDHRVKLIEEAAALAEVDVLRMDMLPRMAASAGYVSRNNEAGASSQSLLTGTQSLEPSTSTEKDRQVNDFSVAWNVLDFGISYVTAKQSGDRTLVAEERRRKAIQNIIQDVRVGWWQALAAQRLLAPTASLIKSTRSALVRSRRAQREGLMSPLDALEYQKAMLETLRDLTKMRQQLEISRTELAALMNLRPGTQFSVAIPSMNEWQVPGLNMSVDELERIALLNRPELREEDLALRIDQADVRKAFLRMFPGIEIDWGKHYDDNTYLFNSSWHEAGLRVAWNLFDFMSGPAAKKFAEAKVDIDNIRRLAMSMAVLSQVRVAVQRFQLAVTDHNLAKQMHYVESGIRRQVGAEAQAETIDQLEVIRRRADQLVARMQHALADAEAQNALGRIYNSVGIDPLPAEVPGHDIGSLTQAIGAYEAKLAAGIRAAVPVNLPGAAPGTEMGPGERLGPPTAQDDMESATARNVAMVDPKVDEMELAVDEGQLWAGDDAADRRVAAMEAPAPASVDALATVTDTVTETPVPAVESDSATELGRVTADVLRIRTQPSTSAAVLAAIRYGRVVELTARVRDWYSIKADTVAGFVHGDFIEPIPPVVASSTVATPAPSDVEVTAPATATGDEPTNVKVLHDPTLAPASELLGPGQGTDAPLVMTPEPAKVMVDKPAPQAAPVVDEGLLGPADVGNGEPLAVAPAATAPEPVAAVVNVPLVNVRGDASTLQAPIAALTGGQMIKLLGRQDDWYRVQVGSVEGFVHGAYLVVR